MATEDKKDFTLGRPDGRETLVGYSQVPVLMEKDVWNACKQQKGGGSPFIRKLCRAYFGDPEIKALVDALPD